MDELRFAYLSDYFGPWSLAPTHAEILRAFQFLNLQNGDEQLAAVQQQRQQTVSDGQIAVVSLSGILMKGMPWFGGTSTVMARRELRAAVANPDVKGIIIAADSPGGTVSGISDLAAEIKAASKQKPVWGFAEDLTASAAYWALSQTDRIVANNAKALIGSIGTIQVVYDVSAAAEKDGVKTLVISTGPLKGTGAMGAPVTDEQKAYLQSIIDSLQEQFDSAVRQGRNLSAKELTAVRHGGAMTADAAMQANLIDAIQPLGKVIADMAQTIKRGAMPTGRRAEFDTRERAAVGSFPTIQRHGLPTLTGA